MEPFLPFIHERKDRKKNNFEQIPLYIEADPPPLIEKAKYDYLDEDSHVIIIEIL